MQLKKELLVKKLKNGEIAVIPTDTIYGIVGSAKNPKTVEKIYKIKSRKLKKPLIILISSLADLNFFKIKLTKTEQDILKNLWPGRVSVIFPCPYKKFNYLHRGTEKLAFRLPKNKSLLETIKLSGPLVAPSANPEGLQPAKTIIEAKKYFGGKIELYAGRKKIISQPSTLIEIKNGKVKVLRQGEVKINL